MDVRNKSDIVIYAGKGAHLGHLPQALLHEIDATHHKITIIGGDSLICNPDCLNNTAVFFMPGLADLSYCATLNGPGNAAIRRYVESGGTYFGICAGAYYGARRITFHAGRPDEISGARELAFFPGTAEGSLPGLGKFYDMTKRSASVPFVLADNGSRFTCFYHGGCTFVADDDADYEILARYEGLTGKPPAVVAMDIGNGKAILSGIHVEYYPDKLDEDLRRQADGADYEGLVSALRASDPERRLFWRRLLDMAGLQLSRETIPA